MQIFSIYLPRYSWAIFSNIRDAGMVLSSSPASIWWDAFGALVSSLYKIKYIFFTITFIKPQSNQ
jgi:hypothetical protein